MKNAHGRTCNKTKLYIYLYISLYENHFENGCIYIYSQFFENQPNEICSHLSEKASKAGFFKPEKLQSHSNEGKGKEGKKKAMPALLVFIVATWEIFGQKKTVSRKWSIWRYMNHVTVCPSVHIVRRPLFTCKPG